MAPLGLVAVVVLLETVALDFDHGTHLLIELAAVLATVLALGPRPALIGLILGAVVAATASLAAESHSAAIIHALVQLLAYLFVGSVCIGVVAFAAGSVSRLRVFELRQRTALTPTPARDPHPAQQGPAHGPVEPLTPRELEILRLATTGVTVDEMARCLCVSPNTVKTHLTHIYGKLGVRGRTDAVRAALHAGCLTPHDICPHIHGDEAADPPVPVMASAAAKPTI